MRVATRSEAAKARGERAGDLIGDLVLDGEYVLQGAIETSGPNQRARGGINELYCHTQAVSLALHAAVDQIAGIESPPDLLRIDAADGRGHGQAHGVPQRLLRRDDAVQDRLGVAAHAFHAQARDALAI